MSMILIIIMRVINGGTIHFMHLTKDLTLSCIFFGVRPSIGWAERKARHSAKGAEVPLSINPLNTSATVSVSAAENFLVFFTGPISWTVGIGQ